MSEKKYILLKTVFNGDNFGSSLQAYALKSYLTETFCIDCVVVENCETGIQCLFDKLKRKSVNFFKSFLSRRLFVDVWGGRFKKKTVCQYGNRISRRFEEFTGQYICPEYLSYKTLQEAALSDCCVRCVCGSDQIWNPTGTSLSKMNFLMFSPRGKNLSYAASIGADEIPYYNHSSFKHKIKNVRWISVREDSAQNLLHREFDISAEVCVDPVALVGREFWLSRIKKHIEGKYVFCYFLNQPSEGAVEEIRRYLDLGLDVKFLSRVALSIDAKGFECLDDVTPFDFITLINDAEYVLTDSFHGMMFSLILHKEFIVFERDYQTSIPQNSRIVSMLDKLEIMDRFAKNADFNPISIKPLNHEHIDLLMEEMVRQSKAFLEEAIPHEQC